MTSSEKGSPVTKKKWGLGLGVAAAIALVITGFTWLSGGDFEDSTTGATPPATTSTPATDAQDVVEALQRLATDPSSLMASGVDDMIDGTADQAVPAGSTVSVDEGSWAPDGIGGGTIVVTISTADGVAASYLAVMVEDAGAWKVLATVPVEAAS